MFSIYLYCGTVPDTFGLGMVTAIPKRKGASGVLKAEDFRGITVNCVMSKIFEHCLLNFFADTKTSSRQFGFKKGLSCQHAIHSVKKIINMFNGKGCTVSIGVVDLSKAFDKVNFFALLSVLIKNNVSKYVVGLLENWFLKSSAIVKWDSSKSETFKLSSGVRQGGVLSPLLFSLYVDSVLKSLENSKLGCYIGDVCCNSFMYAVELILLLAPV